MTEKEKDINRLKKMVDIKKKRIIDSLSLKRNICGINKVLNNIKNKNNIEEIVDDLVQLKVGDFLSNITKVDKVEFEKYLKNSTPHDVVLTFCGNEIVVEVKRIRKTNRHDVIEKEMLNSENFVEITDDGELSKLIRKIIDDKYPQLEELYPNIIFIVSKDILFRSSIVEDAAQEIIRLNNKKYYPNYNGGQYKKLNAIFHMNENTLKITHFKVFENNIVEDLREKIDISDKQLTL